MMLMISTRNDGPELIASNYWESPLAQAGALYLSVNAGAFRLLVTDAFPISELRGATDVVISVGPWPEHGRAYAFELRFRDRFLPPFMVLLSAEQADRNPPPPLYPRRVTLSIWGPGPEKILELPARFRAVRTISAAGLREDATTRIRVPTNR